MITNKDIRVENGSLILNGDPYPLDGQSPEAIMQIVEDNSDTTPTENSTAPITSGGVYTANKAISDTIGDITQTGVTGADVASQITALNTSLSDKVEASSNDGACNGSMVKVSDSRMIIMIQNGGSSTGDKNMRLDLQTDKLRWQLYTAGAWTTIKEISWDA